MNWVFCWKLELQKVGEGGLIWNLPTKCSFFALHSASYKAKLHAVDRIRAERKQKIVVAVVRVKHIGLQGR